MNMKPWMNASAAVLITLATAAHADCDKVTFADVGWTDITATTAATTVVLQALGYETDVKVLSVPVTYTAMADGDAASKPKKSDDPIGDLISNKTKPASDNSAADGSKAAPKADTKTAPKAPSTDTPKTVKPVTAPEAANKKGNYTIQAGSFADEQNAQKLKKQLATQGQLATVTKKQTSDGTIYRVRVGSYASAKDAQAANQKIKGVVLDMTP